MTGSMWGSLYHGSPYFGSLYYRGAGGITPFPIGADTSLMRLSPLYCTDEDVFLRAPQDWQHLVPQDQVLAGGSDGVIAAGSPWVLTSASCDFQSRGVGANRVVMLTGPASAFKAPAFMAVNAVGPNALSMRLAGFATLMGQPAAPLGLTGIAFKILTVEPWIDGAVYDANKFFGIDSLSYDRAPSKLYDQRELLQFTVLTVLRRIYISAAKTKEGDYNLKLALVTAELEDLTARLTVRWGARGNSQPATSVFGARMRR
jgi:hypothetical protein